MCHLCGYRAKVKGNLTLHLQRKHKLNIVTHHDLLKKQRLEYQALIQHKEEYNQQQELYQQQFQQQQYQSAPEGTLQSQLPTHQPIQQSPDTINTTDMAPYSNVKPPATINNIDMAPYSHVNLLPLSTI